MLYWATLFFGFALITSSLGFNGVAAATGGIAQVLFFLYLLLLLITLVTALIGQRHPPPS